jgi:hypothetical protein
MIMGVFFDKFSPSADVCAICQFPTNVPDNFGVIGDVVGHAADKVLHVFHRACVSPWLAQHRTCPTCRVEVGSREFVLAHAVKTRRSDEVLALLKDPISENGRGLAVIIAAQARRWDTLRALLANGPIPEDCRGGALVHVAEAGLLDIVLALLKEPISEESRSLAVAQAAFNGHLKVLQVLVANGPISDYYRDAAVEVANRNGRRDIVDALPLSKARGTAKVLSGGYLPSRSCAIL